MRPTELAPGAVHAGAGSDGPQAEASRIKTLLRYWWVGELARGRAVLDAGCGTGEGSALLAEAGARQVVGVDHARALIDAGSPDAAENVRLQVGDVLALPFDPASFELAVCFGVLDHVEDPGRALDGLARVLAPHGQLAISTTQPAVMSALRERFAHMLEFEQDDWLGSAILPNEHGGNGAGGPVRHMRVPAPAEEPRRPLTMALASGSPLPSLAGAGALSPSAGVSRLLAQIEDRDRRLREQARDGTFDESHAAERRQLRERLLEAEAELVRVTELEDEIRLLRVEIDRQRRLYVGVISTQSWKYTSLLRAAKRAVRRILEDRRA